VALQNEIDPYLAVRQQMVETQLRARDIRDERVLGAMGEVPRHEFVGREYSNEAYADHPIPIGNGQTISQPYIVALTLQALSLRPADKVLEIGTGSGYQTAALTLLASQVYSNERHPGLASRAQETLSRLGYSNVAISVADGTNGWAEFAPFDAIVVSAAAPEIPRPLFEQLREGGRMVIPVGPPEAQRLQLVGKVNGQPVVKVLQGCRFVPLVGEHGYSPI
jgi:protein-L-isoaspartate(D-aspartate) O-methyltransferase